MANRRAVLDTSAMPLHLIKLSVGAASLDHLRQWQKQHGAALPPLRHRTRNFPRRADEILDGGSIYWVINRLVTARQRVTGIAEGTRDDGTRCTDLFLDPVLVSVQPRMTKPFQGWRYLPHEDVPRDVVRGEMDVELPEALRRELAALALI